MNKSILFVIPTFITGYYWQPIFAEISKKYKNVTLITSKWSGYIKGYESTFKVYQLKGANYIIYGNNYKGFYPKGISKLPLINFILKIIQIKPDIVFVSAFSIWSLIIAMFSSFMKYKLIILWDGSSPSVDCVNNKYKTIFRKYIASKSKLILTNTKRGMNYLTKILNVNESKIIQGLYQVPNPSFHKPIIRQVVYPIQDTINIVWVGSISKRKGIDYFLEALKRVKKEGYNNWKVFIVGTGELQKDLIIKYNNYLVYHLNWLGNIDNTELHNVFACSDVFIFSSREDILGVAPLEALCSGLPVICTNQSGAAEFIQHNYNGYLYDAENIEELTSIIIELLRSKEKIKVLSQNAKVSSKNMTVKKSFEMFFNIIEGG